MPLPRSLHLTFILYATLFVGVYAGSSSALVLPAEGVALSQIHVQFEWPAVPSATSARNLASTSAAGDAYNSWLPTATHAGARSAAAGMSGAALRQTPRNTGMTSSRAERQGHAQAH